MNIDRTPQHIRRRICETAMERGVPYAARRFRLKKHQVYRYLKDGGYNTRQSIATQRASSIDLGLAVLEVVATGEGPMSLTAIAHVCDCSVERIRQIQESALRKIRHHHIAQLKAD